jgi:hypothetical protein
MEESTGNWVWRIEFGINIVRVRTIRTIQNVKQSDRQLGRTDRRTDITEMPVVPFGPSTCCTIITSDNETTAYRNR